MGQLTLEPRSTHYAWPFQVEYQKLPGWKAADEGTRARILDRAQAFLESVDPKPEEWFGTKTTPGDALGGCCAATMLLSERPQFMSSEANWWPTWAATFIELADMYKSDAMLKVVQLAATHAPAAIVAGLKLRLDASSDTTAYEIALQRVRLVSSPGVHRVLTGEVWDDSVASENRAAALSALVNNTSDEACQPLLETLEADQRQPTQLRVRAATARFYKSHVGDDWWVRIAQEDELAAGVAHEIADWRVTFADEWKQPASVLAGIYTWIRERHPQRRRMYGTPGGGMEATGPVDWIVELRDRLLSMLAKRATNEDVVALEQLTESFPDLIWAREEAKKARRQKQWSPTDPREILRVAQLGPPSPPSAPLSPAPESPMPNDTLVTQAVLRLNEAEFSALLALLQVPGSILPGPAAALATRHAALLEWSRTNSRLESLHVALRLFSSPTAGDNLNPVAVDQIGSTGVGSPRWSHPTTNIRQPHMTSVPLELITVLAEEFPDAADARAVVVRAGGKRGDVRGNNRPRDLWQDIWVKSVNGGPIRPAALLRAVLFDLPNNGVVIGHLAGLASPEHQERGQRMVARLEALPADAGDGATLTLLEEWEVTDEDASFAAICPVLENRLEPAQRTSIVQRLNALLASARQGTLEGMVKAGTSEAVKTAIVVLIAALAATAKS